MNRRAFLAAAAGSAAFGQSDPIRSAIEKQHDATVKRLQEWIRQPAIAAENRAMNEGAEYMATLLREAGFQQVAKVPTKGHPGVFGVLDAGAPRSVGVYFMYDVKQVDPAEWTSPPFDAAMVERPGLGKVVMGRGAVNQKGPQIAFLAALHAILGAGKKPPVNVVIVAEGEEEIGSPNFRDIVHRPEVTAALKRCVGVFMPSATQGMDGQVTISLGAKGVVELELTSTGERWGRGPRRDIHSSNKARVDSPAWRLVQALNTLVSADGNEPAIDGFADRARPISEAERAMIAAAAARMDEATVKRSLGVQRWIRDVDFRTSLEMLVSRPTVNIEGLVGGYTGPGGKTILPHKAVAKLDLRLVPDMTASGAVDALQSHLAKRGYGDIEVRMTGGYDPTATAADAALIRAQRGAYQKFGIDPMLWPRNAGSWPGSVFTADPVGIAAGHFGLGFGGGAHAPDEFYLIESVNPKLQGLDGAAQSFAAYLQELAG